MLTEVMNAYPGMGVPTTSLSRSSAIPISHNEANTHAYNVRTEQLKGGVGPYTHIPVLSGYNQASVQSSKNIADTKILSHTTDFQIPPVHIKSLPYTPHQRRQLDASLMAWLHSLELLRTPMGQV